MKIRLFFRGYANGTIWHLFCNFVSCVYSSNGFSSNVVFFFIIIIEIQRSDDSVALMVSVFSCWCKTCNNPVIEESNKLGVLSETATCWLFPVTKVHLPA